MKAAAPRPKWLLLGLILPALAAVVLGPTGCSQAELKEKAVLSAALLEFDASAAPLAVMFQSADLESSVAPNGQSVAANVKAARDKIASDWQSVMNAAENVQGAGTHAGRKAWADFDAAAGVLPGDATIGQAGTILSLPLKELMQAEADLWAVVKR